MAKIQQQIDSLQKQINVLKDIFMSLQKELIPKTVSECVDKTHGFTNQAVSNLAEKTQEKLEVMAKSMDKMSSDIQGCSWPPVSLSLLLFCL